ncbi:LacI family DNA-binding transcriptional regulator [Sphingomonas sp. PAMC 26605]|uniref:LacI family DNA-binding transcriptional regulator n=1 Tax=Sphingomonas sp. PAMC 26605 TaxID=1112214 RepID=UPI00026CB112|nr:LacI family DNA-binding transcriptional regulator [Sphingomonas sp. PAMC 26605]
MSRKRSTRANSTDVARLAGVSIAAVSRAFTPGGSISPEMAERVRTAARQLNYVPNTLASSIITRRTNIVALLFPPLLNQVFAALLSEASLRLEEVGKQILLFTPLDEDDFDRTLQRMLEFQVDAIVVGAAPISSRMAALCLGRDVPVVMLGRHVPNLSVHSVRGNADDAGTKAADLLLRGGGRRFGIISGPQTFSKIVERQKAIVRHLALKGAQDELPVADGKMTYDGGYAAALELMRGDDPPDSVFGLTDIMAIGAMDAIRHELGLRIPEDVAVIGFDDIAEAAHKSYDLTTVRTPVRQMVQHMLTLIEPGAGLGEPQTIEIDAQLIVRGSTRAVPAA